VETQNALQRNDQHHSHYQPMADCDDSEGGREPSPAASSSSWQWKDDDLVSSLSSQLALQRELCTQFEVDLAARDELVHLLHERVDEASQDRRRRKSTMRGWKAKVETLEKACRGLREVTPLY
jgi:hypothetical protein